MKFPVIILCLLPFAAAWSYKDPDAWVNKYPKCGGSRQSPISIQYDDLFEADLRPLKFEYYDEVFSTSLTLSNNGHTIEFEVPATVSGAKPTISGGLLYGRYTAETVHFHWGSPYDKGSEHEINGKRFSLEIHILHKNSKYANTAKAREHKDGLAVLAVLFQFQMYSKVKTPGLDAVLAALFELKEYNSTADVGDGLTLGSLLGSFNGKAYINGKDYITYQGSLTTPPCSEAVTWIIFPQILPASLFAAIGFWDIRQKNGKRLINNFRPVQPIGNRKIFYRRS